MEDHYIILGLPSGTEGTKLSISEIKKAYRAKALTSHPDKRPNDPHAATNFQKIQTSYEILIDATARKAFDDLLKLKQERLHRENQIDPKRRKMKSDLEARERAYENAEFPDKRREEEEERAAKKLQEEIARIRASMIAKRTGSLQNTNVEKDSKIEGSDKERMVRVSWERRSGDDYSAQRLKEVFGRFGGVEDVVIQSKGSKKGSGLIVMTSKDGAVAASKNMLGELSNPLLVRLLYPAASDLSNALSRNAEPNNHPELNNLVGAGYHAYEDSILKKLQKAAEKQK